MRGSFVSTLFLCVLACAGVAHAQSVDIYVGADRRTGFDDAMTKVFSEFDTSSDARADDATEANIGAIFHLRDWLALDVGLARGNARGSIDSHFPLTGEIAPINADFRMITGSLAARLTLPHTHTFHPYLSVGAQRLSLEPTKAAFRVDGRDFEIPEERLDTSNEIDAMIGAGVSIDITPAIGINLSGTHAAESGWSTAAALVYHWRRWPRPCPQWVPPPCDDWGPFGPSLPFPYPAPGKLHTQGLDAVLADVQSAATLPSGQHRTEEDLRTFVITSAQRFNRAHGLPEGNATPVSGDGSIPSIAGFERFTTGQQRYLVEIDGIIDRASAEQQPHRELQDVARRALRKLGAKESQPVVVAASVASGSATYWSTRAGAWSEAANRFIGSDRGPEAFPKIDWRHVLKRDLIGALGGILGGVEGAVAGAIIESAVDIIDQAV
jgi:hypothetical protein